MQFKSKDELRKALLHSGTLEIEPPALTLILDSPGINSLLYNDAFAKICFTCGVVSEALKHGRVVYLDLDTVFTSYVRNKIYQLEAGSGMLDIFVPGAAEFESVLPDVCSKLDSDVLVVVDSLNSFYHLYDGIRTGPLNRLLAAYMSLLLSQSRRTGSKLLVTSMMRHKKEREWILAPSSRRLLESKSSVVLSAEIVAGNLLIGIVKHRPFRLDSRNLIIPGSELPIRA